MQQLRGRSYSPRVCSIQWTTQLQPGCGLSGAHPQRQFAYSAAASNQLAHSKHSTHHAAVGALQCIQALSRGRRLCPPRSQLAGGARQAGLDGSDCQVGMGGQDGWKGRWGMHSRQ